MESKYKQGIERKVKEIARDYKKKGYEVIIEPRSSSSLVPPFLKKFHPDIIALSENDNVVVEVKSSESKTNFKLLEELANIVNSKKNWRFELVFTNPRNPFLINNELILIDLKKIEIRVQLCRKLLVENKLEASFLLAWPTLEAAIRIKLKSLKLSDDVSRKPPLHLMKSLFSFGVINQSLLRKLESLNHIRNKLVHGFEVTIEKENIFDAIEMIEYLTGIGDNSKIYKWIRSLDLEGYKEIYFLHSAIRELYDYGIFKAYKKNGTVYVKSNMLEEELELIGSDQVNETLEIIENDYMDGMDADVYFSIFSALEKDD